MKTLKEHADLLANLLEDMAHEGATNDCADYGIHCNGCGAHLPLRKDTNHRDDCTVKLSEAAVKEYRAAVEAGTL